MSQAPAFFCSAKSHWRVRVRGSFLPTLGTYVIHPSHSALAVGPETRTVHLSRLTCWNSIESNARLSARRSAPGHTRATAVASSCSNPFAYCLRIVETCCSSFGPGATGGGAVLTVAGVDDAGGGGAGRVDTVGAGGGAGVVVGAGGSGAAADAAVTGTSPTGVSTRGADAGTRGAGAGGGVALSGATGTGGGSGTDRNSEMVIADESGSGSGSLSIA